MNWNIQVSRRVYEAALRCLLHATIYLESTSGVGAISAVQTLASCAEKVERQRDLERQGEKVQVYRKDQPLWTSPCQLGNPCEVCQAHERRRKQNTRCPLAKLTDRAFDVSAKAAIAFLKDGLAVPGPTKTSIVLTFGKIAHLRDRSLKIDEHFMNAYAEGKKWALAIFDHEHGYHGTALLPARKAPEDARILSFAP